MPHRPILAAALMLFPLAAGADADAATAAEAESDPRAVVRSLAEFVAIPSSSSDVEGVGRAADWLVAAFAGEGLTARRLPTSGNPLVYAEHDPGGASLTVLFYMHYDTQPTGPASDWPSTEGEPFAPRLLSGRFDAPGTRALAVDDLDEHLWKTARLYARGVADDKAPIVMHLFALKRWLKAPGSRHLRVKYLLDGEEEAGSPHIAAALAEHRDLLRADLLVLCDGPMDALGRPSVYLGTRGDMHMRLRVTTSASSAHSGNYGLLPDAAGRLASLLATMKDADGRVAVEGFEKSVVPPTAAERDAMRIASRAETAIARHLGAPRFVGDPAIPYFERLLFHPAFIVNHLSAGRPGNQIPHTAEALLEVRLVTAQDPNQVFEAFRAHVASRMPDASLELLDGVAAARMDPRDPAVAMGIAAVGHAASGEPLVYPTLGGTLPLLSVFERAGFRYIGLPLVNFDNNQHVANENLLVAALPDGIRMLERFLDALAAAE